MARRWLRGVAAGAAMLVGLGWPAVASAGIYYWPLPTAQAPGSANPDHDSYGATPWSYQELPTATTPGSQPAFSPLTSYSTAIRGGLSGWYDPVDVDEPFIAANRSGQAVGVVPAGALALQPGRDRLVAVAWTSPLSSSQKITVTGSFTQEDTDPACLSRPTWTLEQNGNVLATSGLSPPGHSQSISASAAVDPGQTLNLVVGWSGASYSQACVSAGLNLLLQAASAQPSVTLERPASGTRISGAQPTFSGQASSDFGDAPTVTVSVFKGSSLQGALAEKLIARRTGAGFSIPATPPLANGTYTAVAEQDDQAGDAASSAPVTFSVHNVAPHVVLFSPGSTALTTPRPLLRGMAGTRRGDSDSVAVAVFKGTVPTGPAFRSLTTKRGPDGSFSLRVLPPLPNGVYTAVAVQSGGGAIYGASPPQTFRIRVPPPQPIGPAVSLDSAGRASLPITCTASSGVCTGEVLVLTVARFTPVPGGPSGPVRVLFAHVQVPAGSTMVVQGTLPAYVVGVLRRHAPLRVRISAALSDSAGHQVGATVVRMLRRGAPAAVKRA